jgi:hypothetical protein
MDVIVANYFPLAPSHVYLTICNDQNFPQLLSSELIMQMLQIFPLTNSDTLRVGYDSLGAGCFINHLHFELISLDDLGIDSLAVEMAEKKKLFSTRFQSKDKETNQEEISMLDDKFEVTLFNLDYPIRSWKVEVKELQHECKLLENNFNPSIANMVNFILTKLIDQSVPHNILVSDKGQSFYIFPRKFVDNVKLEYNTCWNDLSGLVTFKNALEEEFDVCNSFKENVSLGDEDFDQLTDSIKSSFGELYLIL